MRQLRGPGGQQPTRRRGPCRVCSMRLKTEMGRKANCLCLMRGETTQVSPARDKKRIVAGMHG